MPIDVHANGWLNDYLSSLANAGGRRSAIVVHASRSPSDASRGFPTNSSYSLGAVHPAGHHSHSSQARFDGVPWLVHYIDLPSPSAAEGDPWDPQGFEDYVYDKRSTGEADPSDPVPPAAVKAQVRLDDKEDLFCSSKLSEGRSNSFPDGRPSVVVAGGRILVVRFWWWLRLRGRPR